MRCVHVNLLQATSFVTAMRTLKEELHKGQQDQFARMKRFWERVGSPSLDWIVVA